VAERSSAGLREIRAAPEEIVRRLAGDLLEQHGAATPDLSRAIVVLPNLYAAAGIARALAELAGRSLLLPRLTTLAAWCADEPAATPAVPESVRQAALFEALRSRGWFDAPDLWPLAGELARLFDQLTRQNIALPAGSDEFVRQLEQAYRAKAGEPLQLEARLVHELWHASLQPLDGRSDPAALYHLQLARMAASVAEPVYAAGLPRLTPAEEHFFEACAQRVAVTHYRIDTDAVDAGAVAKICAAAWPLQPDAADLRSRAHAFASEVAQSPIAQVLSLFAANSLEQEARAVETQVRCWLIEGKQRIAVVALDRLVARRARAMLERARVMVQDETGWLFSTTSASTVIMRWLDAMSGGFYHEDLLDLVKSPFVFSGWQRRREAVYRLERIIRRESVVADLDNYLQAARATEEGSAAAELLERLGRAAKLFRREGKRPLSDWLAQLFASMSELGIDLGLRRDPAGLQLLELLELRARELGRSRETFSFVEWRQWLNRQLESAEFRDTGIVSPVVFTHLPLTRLRAFDAVILVGCDAAHLPGAPDENLFFNQSVRGQLGLPGAEQETAQVREDLIGLLSRSSTALATWQSRRRDEPNLLSPLLERLEVFHELAYATGLANDALPRLLPEAEMPAPAVENAAAPLPALAARPAPSIHPALVPSKVSASGYNSLLACPYQFYARYVLRLRETEDVQEALEKRDYGEYVHRILRLFHERHPQASVVPRPELERTLIEISNEVFRAATEANYLSHAWALRWRALIPRYLDWQLDRERHGWVFHAAELKRSIEIALPNGATLMLEGRIDRVDRHEIDGATTFAVVDYKTSNKKLLKDALVDTGEDIQLPVYVNLLDAPVEDAFYLSLDGKSVDDVQLDDDAFEDAQQAIERLRRIFVALHTGGRTAAQGIEPVCRWCEMKGLCRRPYWH
jgi:ATP-dependent helicase/nuclease subunit B